MINFKSKHIHAYCTRLIGFGVRRLKELRSMLDSLVRVSLPQDTRYFLADREQSCDDYCKREGMMCRGQGGFPSGDARPIFEQLGHPCSHSLKYAFEDSPGYAIDTGVCYGGNMIPAEINCSAGWNPMIRRLCPCTNPSTCDSKQRERCTICTLIF